MHKIGLSLAVTATFVLAACSGSTGGSGSAATTSSGGSSAATAPAGTTSAPAPNVKSQLLSVSDLPTGWAIDNSQDNGDTSTPPCLRSLKSKLQTTDKAEADFVKGTDFPALQQQLAYYGTTSTAAGKYTAATGILNNCKDVSFTTDGEKVHGTIGQLSFPKLGEDSTAWQLVLSQQGITVGIDAVLVHKASELALFLYGDLGTPDTSEFTDIINKALAKMPAR